MSTATALADIKAIITAATARPTYTHDEAQKDKPSGDYTIVYLSRRFGGNVRGQTRENDLRRLQVRAVSKSAGNVLLLEDRVAGAFLHTSHTVDGRLVCFEFESSDAAPERDDDGYYTRLTDYTF